MIRDGFCDYCISVCLVANQSLKMVFKGLFCVMSGSVAKTGVRQRPGLFTMQVSIIAPAYQNCFVWLRGGKL